MEKEAGVTFDKYLLVRHRHKVISGVIYLMDVMNLHSNLHVNLYTT